MAETVELTSPLTETTRKERRLLLIMSIVLLATVQGGLRPTKIAQLGIDFLPEQLASMLAILFAVHAYILVAFIIGAAADSRLWDGQFFDSRQKLEAQIEQSRQSAVQKAGGAAVGFADAVTAFKQLVEGAQVHLRGRTLAAARRFLVIVEDVEQLVAYKRGKPVRDQVDAAISRVIKRKSEDLPTSAVELGVLNSLCQADMEHYCQYLLDARTIRARFVGLIRRRYLNELVRTLRYTYVPNLSAVFSDLKRLVRVAGVGRRQIETVQAQLAHIEAHMALPDFDRDTFHDAAYISLSSAFGVRSAREELSNCIEAIAKDVSRSMRRFSRKALWEQRIPSLIGGLILALALLHASVDGLLAMR